MPDLTIRPATSEDDASSLAIHNRIHGDMPPVSLEEYRSWMRRAGRLERHVAETHGEIVGTLDLAEMSYLARPNTFECFLEVDEAYRGRGIGSQMYELMTERAAALGAVRVYGGVREHHPAAITFLERRGCRRTGHVDRMSYLDVRRVSLDGLSAAEKRLLGEGIRITTLEDLGTDDEDVMRAVCRMEGVTERGIPGSEEYRPPIFEEWREEQLHGPGKSPRWFWVASDGERPVGLSRLRLRGERMAMNAYTGVDPEYRGRGIARALKLRTIEWARANGIERIYTGNEVTNRPILAINISLGYEALPAEIEMIREMDT